MLKLSLCFASVKHVSSFSSKSLDQGGQKVCGYVSVTILDHLCEATFKSKDSQWYDKHDNIYLLKRKK
jgi:hypothetical protein